MRAVSTSSPSNGPFWNGMSAAVSENGSGNLVTGSFLTAMSVPRAVGLSEIRRATRYSVPPLGLALATAGARTMDPVIEPPGPLAVGASAAGTGAAAGIAVGGAAGGAALGPVGAALG